MSSVRCLTVAKSTRWGWSFDKRGGVIGDPPAKSCAWRFGHGEVDGDDLDVRWQRRLGALREGADRHARVY